MPESKRKQSNENPSVQQQALTIQQALKLAMQHHGVGELPQAERLYRQILHSDPNQPVALHMRGVIAYQAGKHEMAVGLITKAIEIKPDFAEAHSNLANVLKALGRLDDAVSHYHRSIDIKPDFAEAHNNLGNALRELGRFDDAVTHYREAISIKPDYAGAQYNLGTALRILGQLDGAVTHYKKATGIKPDHFEAHYNLGNVFKALGHLDEAVIHYHRAIDIKPDYANAHNSLGNVFKEFGQLDDAISHYRKAIKIEPDFAGAYSNLGTALQALSRLSDAVVQYQKALKLKPDFAEVHSNLGNALKKLGRQDDAISHYRKAIEIEPDFAEAHSNLGAMLKKLGRLDEAVIHYRKAIDLKSDFAETYSNLGNVLKDLGRLDDAIVHHQKAIDINPDYAQAYNNLGVVLQDFGRLDDAAMHYEKALELKSDYAEAHSNFGNVLRELGRLDDAIFHYRKAIDIKPDFAEVHSNLGNAFRDLGRLDDAVIHQHKALELKPDFALVHSNLGGVLQDLGRLNDAFFHFRKAIDIDPDDAEVHSNLIFCQDFCQSMDLAAQQAERKRWDQSFGVVATGVPSHKNNKDPERRLRIGYVSADFRIHSAAQGFGPLIQEHDREHFEVVCYSGNRVNDASTETFKAAASLWRSTVGLSDERLAELIREDEIDILVDLSGHTARNRLPVFAHKPAPIQMSGVGHLPPGLSAIDYRLTSEEITKRSEVALFPEQPIYLCSYMGYMPPVDLPSFGGVPCLETGVVTFGCLNRFIKVSHEAIELWASILLDVPEARLVLKDKRFAHEAERGKVCDLFGTFGIAFERLNLLPLTSFQEHLATYNQIDIALDPFPHGGGISALESLLMGVPVVGMGGEFKLSSRITRMMCAPVGLNEWMADSAQSYKTIAIEAAQNPERLSALRSTLRQRVEDVYSLFTGDVERAYRLAWKGWCEGSPPKPLDMTA